MRKGNSKSSWRKLVLTHRLLAVRFSFRFLPWNNLTLAQRAHRKKNGTRRIGTRRVKHPAVLGVGALGWELYGFEEKRRTASSLQSTFSHSKTKRNIPSLLKQQSVKFVKWWKSPHRERHPCICFSPHSLWTDHWPLSASVTQLTLFAQSWTALIQIGKIV